jgi:glycosyltransferase involved in cell wall biosynthesis
MRIAFIAHPNAPGGWYRGIGPMLALHARGHEVRQVIRPSPAGEIVRADLVAGCDVLHVYRRHEPDVLELVRKAKERGMAIVYDNDDDLTAVPREDEGYRDYGGLAGDRARNQIRKLVQSADLVTTPSTTVAERFREYGGAHVQVIENYCPDRALSASAPPHGDDVIVGWLAGSEHHVDVERVPIRDAVGRLLDAHAQLRFRTIGVSLRLQHERYEPISRIDFFDLPPAMAEFDIGIAVIADIPFNQGRSNIKIKEYAVLGKPWLASDVGPYRGLGEQQGGRLVANDRWYEEIERLLAKPRDRKKLAKRARRWGREQAISANAKLWEDALNGAVARARGAGAR